MGERPREHVRSLLSDFETAMLVTRAESGELRSRPMSIADHEGDAELWFATSIDSGKVNEIAEDSQVNVTLQSRDCFVSISGAAEVVRDTKLIRKLWKESWRVWFPKGRDDPELALIRVVPDMVEFWDLHGKRGVRKAWETARALLRGERPNSEPGIHATVRP